MHPVKKSLIWATKLAGKESDMGNLRPSVFGLIKMLFRAEKRSAKIFGKEIRTKFFSGNLT